MDLKAGQKSEWKFEIKNHCHINTNEEGDRFVGIKVDSDNVMVFFPIGYELTESDVEIRRDIRHLIQVLSEFTNKEERLIAVGKSSEKRSVDFPINAFMNVIEYYFSIGGRYYIETELTYKTAISGKQDWARTVRKHIPLIQRKDDISSFIFTEFEVRSSTPNDTKLITQINRYCVYEAFKYLGWLYLDYLPEESGPHPDVRTSISIVQQKIGVTNDDKKKKLFNSMLDMLKYIDENIYDMQFCYGTEDFEHVWEKLIDRAFGVKDKENYFPRSRWLLDYGKYKEKHPLMPDTIMIYNNKYYVLDAKYYKYGWTANPDHLPNGSSINKQITYGEYLEKSKGINKKTIFNAFIMPYNMLDNKFGLNSFVENIGEAVGNWKGDDISDLKYYEQIQGIVMDTRHLMYHYSGNPVKEKIALADCIEEVMRREPINCYENNIVPISNYESYEGMKSVAADVALEDYRKKAKKDF